MQILPWQLEAQPSQDQSARQKIQVAENSSCQQVGGGETCLERKEKEIYSGTVGLNQLELAV